MLLEGGLHAHVPLRGDVEGGDEDAAARPRASLPACCRVPLRAMSIMQVVAVEAAAPGHLLEDGVDLDELRALEDVAHEGEAKRGSMPLEQPAMMLMVPVGAMVRWWRCACGIPVCSQIDCLAVGEGAALLGQLARWPGGTPPPGWWHPLRGRAGPPRSRRGCPAGAARRRSPSRPGRSCGCPG